MMSQTIADDITMTRQLWHDPFMSVPNSLDIDFIHGDIHGRSCKEVWCFTIDCWATQKQNKKNKNDVSDTEIPSAA